MGDHTARRVVRERDEARAAMTVFTSRPDCSALLLGLMRERDEAREGLAACEASKADEERANAGLAKEYASMQQRWLDQRKVSVGLRHDVEVAERERDEARAVAKEVEAEAFHWKDEAAEAVERNAVISEERNEARAEVECLRAALRQARANLGGQHTEVGPSTGPGKLSCACPRCVIDRALGDG